MQGKTSPRWLPTLRRRVQRYDWRGLMMHTVAGAGPLLLASWSFAAETDIAGMVRASKPQDRSSYQAPVARSTRSQVPLQTAAAPETETDSALPELEPAPDAESVDTISRVGYDQPIVHRVPARRVVTAAASGKRSPEPTSSTVRPVAHRHVAAPVYMDEPVYSEPSCGWEPACGCEAAGYACDGGCNACYAADNSCDAWGGNACGPDACGPRLCADPCQWFGKAELLLMWRVGDGLPILATTSTAANGTGAIGANGTQRLFGNERVLDELTAGGRITLGTWLDSQHCSSLVLRGWGAEQATFGFSTNEDRNAIIARPFFNVTDGQTAGNISQIIATPNQSNGSININGTNDVFGGDVSLRQRWCSGLGGAVDFLYGYQYLRMEDDLRIATSTTSLPGTTTAGTIIDVVDRFSAENEFHGAQVGIAARYRERCWSFDALLKSAFGALDRSAIRSGTTNRSLNGVNAPTDPNGLLVRSTNSGTSNDSTFAWVPELDVSLAWYWTPNLDLSFGYHAVGLTDALQASGTIDPQLAVNAADNPTGQQRPSSSLRFDTFYVHGIHFGVNWNY